MHSSPPEDAHSRSEPVRPPSTATVNEVPADPDRTAATADGAAHPAADAVPSEWLGRFALAGEIGRGGMGCVMHGHDPDLDRDLAIKILLPDHSGQPHLEKRFLEEARIAGRLEHPGIPPVHELGRAEDGRPFFAMKLIRGQTLAELLRVGHVSNVPDEEEARCKRAPRDLSRFLAIFEQVCQTLAYAHAHGVIHRDLKPSNVMVGKYGEVQVMDWGLAKVLDEASQGRKAPPERPSGLTATYAPGSPGQTQSGSVLGTPAYMSPEQARGQIEKLDERTDVFGLGAILCEILTSSPPFLRGETSVLIRRSARGEVGEALARLDDCGADAELIALAKDCLAPEACDRPNDAGEVARRVTTYRAGVERRLHEAEVERAAAQARAEEARAKVQAEKRARRLTLGLALAALLLLALGGGAFAWLWTQRSAMVHDVEMALADARSQMDLEHWAEARTALERAAGRLADGGPTELRQRVEQARAAVDMVRELEEIRLHPAIIRAVDFGKSAAVPLYAGVFRRFGLDLSTPEEAAALVRASPVREPVLAALQDWAEITKDAAERRQLLALVEQADDDEWRRRFRAMAERRDVKSLEALARREETLEQSPTILTHLGSALVSLGSPNEGVLLLRRGQQRYSGDFWINHYLGITLLQKMKDHDGAVRYMTAASALKPDSSGELVNLGHALYAQGKLAECIAVLRRAVTVDPMNAHAHMNLGSALDDQGKGAEAVAELREAVRLAPNLAVAHYNLGLALSNQKEMDEAIAAYRRAIALDPKSAQPYHNLGSNLAEQGKVDEAIACYRRAVALAPKIPLYHINLGLAHYKQGKLDEAIASIRRAITIDPKSFNAHNNLGVVLAKQGKLGEAIASYRLAITLDAKNASAHANLGNVLYQQGKLDDAIAALRQAITLNPKHVQALGNIGSALCDQNKLAEALKYYRQAIQIDSTYARAHTGLGNVLEQQGRLNEAVASHRRAIELDPNDATAHGSLGNPLMQQGKWAEASACFRKAITLKPKEAIFHHNLGVTLIKEGKAKEAVTALRQAISISPKLAPAYRNLGNALQALQKFDDAVAAYRQAIKLDPKDFMAHFNLGVALVALGKLDEAAAAYRQALVVDPNMVVVYCNLGEVFKMQGRFTKSLESVRRGHELGSKQPGWPHPSALWLRQAERLVAREKKMLDVLAGKHTPASAAEWIEHAALCVVTRRNTSAARLFVEAFTIDASLASNLKSGARFAAAGAAALAAAGKGIDAAKLNDRERFRLRRQALTWLRADLAAWARELEIGDPAALAAMRSALQSWQKGNDLAGIRDPEALAKLSVEERQACEKLWAEVAALLRANE
jgi:serine/threonine-protein kinase